VLRFLSPFLCLLAVGCSSSPPSAQLTVAAAASLTSAFQEVSDAFTQETGISVNFTFAATGSLAQQIRNGAPYDVFASADARSVDALIADGFLKPETRMVFARGRLVLTIDPASGLSLESLTDLARPEVSRIVIANPAHAPYGLAARQALERAGIWDAVQSKVVYAETVRQAAQVVATGNAPVGLLAASVTPGPGFPILEIQPDLYDPIQHVLAVRQGSPVGEEAQRFVSFLGTSKGRRLLEKHGLRPPAEP
jgi:molybdate transport system substrate-binding protein